MAKSGESIKIEYQTLVVIWAALLVSQLVFVVLIYFVKPELFSFDVTQPPLENNPLVILVFALAAIVVFVLSIVLRNQYIRRAARDRDASCVQTGLTIGCALSEMCSILGVILAIAFEYRYFFLWILLGLVGILFHFPRKGNLDAANFDAAT